MSILLVEDDEVDIINVKRAFKKCQISSSLIVANNGIEALNLLRGNGVEKINPEPVAILLDINMPKMSGLEFLKELRSDEMLKHLNVFILTTSNELSDKKAAYDQNVAGYFIKPVDFQKFIEIIKTLNDYWKLNEYPIDEK